MYHLIAGGDAVNLNYILVDEVSNSEIDWKSISDEELAGIHERQISILTVVEVLPIPPFWLATAITRVRSGCG